jgi:hypothetical protein
VYAGSLTAGWKNRRGITIAKNGALGALLPKVSALTMLGLLVSLCLASPTAACLAGRGANLAKPRQEHFQHHLKVEKQIDEVGPHLRPPNQTQASIKLTSGGNFYSRYDPPKLKNTASGFAPKKRRRKVLLHSKLAGATGLPRDASADRHTGHGPLSGHGRLFSDGRQRSHSSFQEGSSNYRSKGGQYSQARPKCRAGQQQQEPPIRQA